MKNKVEIKGYSVSPTNVSCVLFVNGKVQQLNATLSHPNFEAIVKQLKSDVADDLVELFNIAKAVEKWGEGRVTIEHGVVKYAGMSLHNALADRILSMIEDGYDANPLIKFLEKVQQNPSETSRQELFDFLEGNSLPITKDGNFLAYKRVRPDFKDIHSGTMDNSPGKVVTMLRDVVDSDRNNTCSRGLHFASYDYALNQFGNHPDNPMVIVEINPADVVSIPVDYNRQKGRTWKYKVISTISIDTLKNANVLEETTSVVDLNEYDRDTQPDFGSWLDTRYNHTKQKRDASGRFVKSK